MGFIDEVKIDVSSGKGGPGKVSFRRESMLPRGGPDGGDGGRGGSVIFRPTRNLNTLLKYRFKKKYRAEDGHPGEASNRSGLNGVDLVLDVPVGTILRDETGQVVKDLDSEEDFIYLPGGIGGKGNTFYKSSVNQAPGIAQKGMPGQSQSLILELKLLADVGIIGLPNAGKSTLISKLSAAKPKIADYPFTTLAPNLGVGRLSGDRTYVLADIPGLIPGAHKGAGLGSQFLRHIERTRVFVHLIEVGPMTNAKAIDSYDVINTELKAHDEAHGDRDGYQPLANRKQIVVLNKVDLLPPEELRRELEVFRNRNIEVIAISAATSLNLDRLKDEIGRILN